MIADLESVVGNDKPNFWFYGDTGTGKSYAARDEAGADVFLKSACNKWWDGYRGQEHVILEDMDRTHKYMGFYLKIWADRYAYPAEVKGGAVRCRPKRIWVTSNYSIDEIWQDEPQTSEPLKRRFKQVRFQSLMNMLMPSTEDVEIRQSWAHNFVAPLPTI